MKNINKDLFELIVDSGSYLFRIESDMQSIYDENDKIVSYNLTFDEILFFTTFPDASVVFRNRGGESVFEIHNFKRVQYIKGDKYMWFKFAIYYEDYNKTEKNIVITALKM